MKILLLLVLVLPLFLEVCADDPCYYFNTTFGRCPDLKQPVNHNFTIAYLINNNVRNISSYVTGSDDVDDCKKKEDMMKLLAPCVCRTSYAEPLFYFVPAEENAPIDGYFVYCLIGDKAIEENPLGSELEVYDLLMNMTIGYAKDNCPILKHFEGCPDVERLKNENLALLVWKNSALSSYMITTTINKIGLCDMRILYPCLCRSSYKDPVFFFLPDYDTFDDYPAMCIVGEKANDMYVSNNEKFLTKELSNKIYAENNCPILTNGQGCRNTSPYENFTFVALKNNTVFYSSRPIFTKAARCDMSILKPCLCRPNYEKPIFFFLPDYDTFEDYPAMCIVGEKANKNYQVGSKLEIFDLLMKMTIEYAKDNCPILIHIEGCPDVESLQNEKFTFAALKNGGFFYSSTSIINKARRCDMSILSPCLCRSSYDEPHYFFLSDYDTFDNYPAMCIVGNATNQKYQFGSELEIYDFLISKNIENMPRSLINPFVIDNDTKSSCTDMYGNPTKDVNGQKTCMISFSDESDEFMYAGPLIGSSMLDFDDNENFTKSDVIEACRSTTDVSKFEQINKNWTDWCFGEKNTLNVIKVQCCCVANHSLCSLPKVIPNKTNDILCLASSYGQVEVAMKKPAANFLNLVSSCAVSLKFEYHNDSYTDFQFRYERGKKCDDKMKSKTTQITVEKPSMFCSSELVKLQNITVIKCCTDGHFCNHNLIPEFIETTECSHQNRMEQIAMGTSDSTCTHFFDLGIENFTKILIGFNAEIPDGQPRKIVQTSSKDNSFVYDLNYIYVEIVQEDNSTCPNSQYNESGEYRPIIQVSCEGNKCDEDIFVNIPFDIPLFLCQNLSDKFVSYSKYEALMENSTGWICYVEIEQDTIQAGELINFANHTDCLVKDVFQDDGHFCCSNVFNSSQEDTPCTVEKLSKKRSDVAKKEGSNSNPKDGLKNSQYYCKIKNVQPNFPCTESRCFVSRVLEQSDDSNPIEPAGCTENAENYIISDKDNTQMASVSLACRSAEDGCSLLKDVEGNERIVCCCDRKECDKMERDLPEKVGKAVSSYRSH